MKQSKKIAALIMLFLALCYATTAQDTTLVYKSGWGTPATFCRPFLADMSSTITSAGFGVNSNNKEYDISPDVVEDHKPTVVTNLGVSIPVYTYNFKEDRFGLAISMPIHFQTWIDIFEPTTAPVLNTDYNFAFIEFKFIQRFQHKWFNNYSVKFIPFYHQSTHIGDELTIARIQDGIPLTRVNVSYNYWELSFWLNEAERRHGKNHSLRLGFLGLLKPNDGWYSIRQQEAQGGDTRVVVEANRSYEFYIQYQLQTGKWLLSNDRWQNVFSAELRNRANYDYPAYMYNENSDAWESVIEHKYGGRWGLNMYYGWRLIPDITPYNSLGFGVQAYYGVNPHGQFRNLPDYWYVGATLVFE